MQGQDQQMEDFCRREYPKLVGAVAMYTGDVQLAEDVAQEALTRVLARWSRIEEVDRPGAYVHRVAMNLANQHYRRRRTARRLRDRRRPVDDVHLDVDSADVVAVRRAVAGLPARQRQAVVLRYQGDLALADIADVMGVTVGTVKSQLHHAHNTLRALLSSEEIADAH